VSIEVLIADDQAMVRAGFAALLDAHEGIRVTGQAADGLEAVTLSARLDPDVILMDVRMPQLDGIEATRRLLGPSYPAAKIPRILMLTTFDIDDYVFAALRAGASGFLLKDATPEELVAAVRTVHAGDALLSPRVTRTLVAEFVGTPARRTPPSTAFADLTDREREVLLLMAAGFSNGEIAERLFIAEQTTKSHVSRILTKLGLRDRVHAVVLAYESGLVAPGDRDRQG
jgi:DNA-binding NarL/FixJ family response regulator